MSYTKQRLIAFLFPLLLALPFLNRAYFVDDSYFVEIATWLKDHPDRPYEFRTDDAGLQNPGWEEDGFVRMVNPLLHHYYLALLLKIGGEREWFLRLGCVFLSCFSALFLWGLARRWTSHPLLATLLVLVTPVHWLTSYSLLIDSTLGFLFLGGLYFFVRAAEKDSPGHFFISGLFMGSALITKYTGVFLFPLTLLWSLLYWKKIVRTYLILIPWCVAMVFLVAYSLWTANLYGAPHILAASKRMIRVMGWSQPFILAIFLSGVSLLPVLLWTIVSKRLLVVGSLLGFIVMILFSSPYGGFSLFQGFFYGFLFATTILLLGQLIPFRKVAIYPRDIFLALWVLGFLLMMVMVVGWVAARYFIIVIPGLIFLLTRFVEIRFPNQFNSLLKGALAFCLCFTSFLAYADYKQADPSRDIGDRLIEAGYSGGEGKYYLGDSFTMSYLKDFGWTPWFPGTKHQIGDQILSKRVTMPPIYAWRKEIHVQRIDSFDYPTWFPLKVMDYKGSAGFYASLWGGAPVHVFQWVLGKI